MVATLIYAGLRREELLWLTIDDLDRNAQPQGLLRVRAKTVGDETWQPKTKVNRAVPVSRTLRRPQGILEQAEDARRCLAEELQARAQAAAHTVGPNSWEAIFFSGVTSNEALLTFIIMGGPHGAAGQPAEPAPAADVAAEA